MNNNNRVIGKWTFHSDNEYEAALRDLDKIKSIEESIDLSDPESIRQLYSKMQTGIYKFESVVGRDFDDKIYEKFLSVNTNESDKKDKTKKQSKMKSMKQNEPNLITASKPSDGRLRRLILIIASLVGSVCLLYFAIYCYAAWQNQQKQDALIGKKTENPLQKIFYDPDRDTSTKSEPVQEEKPPQILEKYEKLYNENKKLIGWLKIDDTNIDYPVLQTVDNDYYLTHGYNQEYDRNGSIFLDYECCIYPRSTNLIIYGHHMKSGKMFGALNQYAQESFYKEHMTISFDTIYDEATYEIMYVFRSKVFAENEISFKYYQFIQPNSVAEFDSAMDEMTNMSLYDTGVVAEYGDELLTLSTCDYTQDGGRFVVVAKKKVD